VAFCGAYLEVPTPFVLCNFLLGAMEDFKWHVERVREILNNGRDGNMEEREKNGECEELFGKNEFE